MSELELALASRGAPEKKWLYEIFNNIIFPTLYVWVE